MVKSQSVSQSQSVKCAYKKYCKKENLLTNTANIDEEEAEEEGEEEEEEKGGKSLVNIQEERIRGKKEGRRGFSATACSIPCT